MRILIDLQGAQSGSRLRGIGRYSIALARAMVENGPQHDFYILLNGMMEDAIASIRLVFDDLLPRDRILIWYAPGPTAWYEPANTNRRLAAELIREAYIAYLAPDAVHVSCMTDGWGDDTTCSIGAFTNPIPTPTAITFYDVIPLVQSDVYLRPHPVFEATYRTRLAHMQRADLLLAISESARQEAITYLNVDAAKVYTISTDADPIFRKVVVKRKEINRLRDAFGLRQRFILYSGATDERKNHLRLIAAYSMLAPALRSRYQLVFAGRLLPAHAEKFRHYGKALGVSELDFVITGAVTDDELIALYNLCTLFVMPSWHEGFGLPALEAMRCGAPVIGSNNTSVPEVIGHPQALFDPFDTGSIAAKLDEVLTSPALLADLVDHGRVHARRFSWKASAQVALKALEGLPRHDVRPFDEGVVERLIGGLGAALPADADDTLLLDVAHCIGKTFRKPGPKRLFVDVSELIKVDAGTGIQRVVRNILRELAAAPPAGFVLAPVYTVHETAWYRHARRYAARQFGAGGVIGEEAAEDELIEVGPGDVFIGLDLHHRTPPPEVDISLRMRAVGGYAYFVVYDLLPVLMPHNFPAAVPPRHLEWLRGVAASDGAVCISKAVADDLIAWLPGSGVARDTPLKVGWFHLGSDLSEHDATSGTVAPDAMLLQMAQRPSFLMVGTLEPRKGHLQALIAFDRLWSAGVDANLVIVGRQGWNVDLQTELIRTSVEANKRLFWRESVSDAMLTRIYDEASCLIAASDGEGFGLPLVEASDRGIAVIARDIPVFREVAADFATFFQGNRGDDLARVIQQWLGRRHATQPAGMLGHRRITWRNSKDQLLANVLGKDWYHAGTPPRAVTYCGSDWRLSSAVGRRFGTVLHSTHREGVLLFGPYLTLPAGTYSAILEVAWFHRGRLRADICTDAGKQVLATREVNSASPGTDSIGVKFVVQSVTADVEVRLFVNQEAGIEVRSLTIVPLDLPSPFVEMEVAADDRDRPAGSSTAAVPQLVGTP